MKNTSDQVKHVLLAFTEGENKIRVTIPGLTWRRVVQLGIRAGARLHNIKLRRQMRTHTNQGESDGRQS